MKELVNRILDEERLARQRIEEAKARAEKIVSAAREEAARLKAEAERLAIEEARRLVAEAERQAGAEGRQMVEDARREAAQRRAARADEIPLIAGRIVGRLLSLDEESGRRT